MINDFCIVRENNVQKCAHFPKNVHIFVEIMIISNKIFKTFQYWQDIARTTFFKFTFICRALYIHILVSVIPRETIGNLTCRYFRKCAHFWRIPRVRKCAHFRKMCTFLRTWMFVKIQINNCCESQRSVTQNEIICFQILRCFNLHRRHVVWFI